MALQIDRILETAVKQNALETWLVPGRPPLFRIDGQIREAMIPSLTAGDIDEFLSILGEAELKDYNARNVADFPLTYGGNHARFQVTLVKTSSELLAMLRLTERPPAS